MGVEGACGGEYAVGLCDAHCHVDFAADARSVARDADRAGCALLCSTVEPQGFDRARALFLPASFSLVRVGVGMHPRWVAPEPEAARAQAREVVRRLSHAAFAGEIGLDFGPRYAATADVQKLVFEQIVRACAEVGGMMLSIHAVRSAGTALDILERAGAFDSCRCVLHWFSGTSDELNRARALGCWFSVGERMLATRRGRAYVRALPADRLLLETDLPTYEGTPFGFSQLEGALQRTRVLLGRIAGEQRAQAVDRNARDMILFIDTGEG